MERNTSQITIHHITKSQTKNTSQILKEIHHNSQIRSNITYITDQIQWITNSKKKSAAERRAPPASRPPSSRPSRELGRPAAAPARAAAARPPAAPSRPAVAAPAGRRCSRPAVAPARPAAAQRGKGEEREGNGERKGMKGERKGWRRSNERGGDWQECARIISELVARGSGYSLLPVGINNREDESDAAGIGKGGDWGMEVC